MAKEDSGPDKISCTVKMLQRLLHPRFTYSECCSSQALFCKKKQNKSLKRVREEGGMKQLLCREGWVGSLSGWRSIVLVLVCQQAVWSCAWEAWVD